YGVKGLIDMLRRACSEGIDAVPEAPTELRAFIDAMETVPDWADMELVEQGARDMRISAAFVTPFINRGVFLATFRNVYAALPMALTGTLSDRRAAHRVHETSSFFAVSTLPGALHRFGPGFEAAAMVRLMHSMVRYNALKHSEAWDVEVYGLPVPQLDQMPAGLWEAYLLAVRALDRGRREYTQRERAMLEFSRYRCYLLGMPEELLPSTVEEMVSKFNARGAMLRAGFDDATCGELVRSTLAAYLRPDKSRFDKIADKVERSWSKGLFVLVTDGDRKRCAEMGVDLGIADMARIAVTAPFVVGRFAAVILAGNRGVWREKIDAYTLRTLKKRLAMYGVPDFTSDVKSYAMAK
ncbi:hypothetical protein Rwratislav_48349, partial [Rhodococcus wratislaviensis IFP 2016]